MQPASGQMNDASSFLFLVLNPKIAAVIPPATPMPPSTIGSTGRPRFAVAVSGGADVSRAGALIGLGGAATVTPGDGFGAAALVTGLPPTGVTSSSWVAPSASVTSNCRSVVELRATTVCAPGSTGS